MFKGFVTKWFVQNKHSKEADKTRRYEHYKCFVKKYFIQ